MKDPLQFILPHIRKLDGYVPGYQTESTEWIKLNTNENAFPVADAVKEAIRRELDSDKIHRYPDPVASELRRELARRIGQKEEAILIGNGSDEVLSILFRAILRPQDSIAIAKPTYSLYPILAALQDASTMEVDLKPDWHMDFAALKAASDQSRITIVVNPNAPTGIAESRADLVNFKSQCGGLLLVDEAYAAFGAESLAHEAGVMGNEALLVAGTFSKAYSLAGQRIGWLVGHPDFISELMKVKDSYNVSRLAQACALAALRDEKEFLRRTRVIVEDREFLVSALRNQGFEVIPSAANFIYVSPPDGKAKDYFDHLKRHKILVRYFPEGRGERFVRITIGQRRELEALINATRELFVAV